MAKMKQCKSCSHEVAKSAKLRSETADGLHDEDGDRILRTHRPHGDDEAIGRRTGG